MVFSLCWLREFLQGVGKKFLPIWVSVSAFLTWLFKPNEAWGFVWILFVLSFFTKMIELAWDGENEKFSFKLLVDERFSSRIAATKALPKAVLYLVCMVILSGASVVFPGPVYSAVHTGVVGLAFTIEALNNLQHLRNITCIKKLVDSFINIFKKNFPKGD